MARTGKIARLPHAVREELNNRLRDGEFAPTLLPWLNSLPEAVAVCQAHFAGEVIKAINLSNWRCGGYQDWLKTQENRAARVERTREFARMSVKLAQASDGSLSEGAAAILGGSILEVLEGLDDLRDTADGPADPAQADTRLTLISQAIEDLTLAVTRLRRGDQGREALRQSNERLRQKDKSLKLSREQFEQKLREYQDKVAAQKQEIEGALTRAKTGGITAETLQRIEEAARLL